MRKTTGFRTRAGLWFAVAVLVIFVCAVGAEHGPAADPPQPSAHELSGRFPDKPSIAPAFSIPVEPLGFTAPGHNYLGMRQAMVSLDFLGEDRLLFTFHIPGLMQREAGNTSEDQRQIRAVVLALPSEAAQSETTWTLHDRQRYLQIVDDDHFLLRDRDTVFEGDAALNLKPMLRFPGELLSVDLTSGGQYIMVNSREPAPAADKSGSLPATSAAGDTVFRILRRDSGQVMLVTRVHDAVQIPLNSDGYLSPQRGTGMDWIMVLNAFTGQTQTLGTVKSACAPAANFLSEREALITACSDSGDTALVAMTTSGNTLWIDLTSDRLVWPQTVTARNGLRFARASLYVSHGVNAFAPLGADDIKGQWVRVIDAATGKVALDAPASPILDAGGNVAISPSGRRVAVLHAGAIQVFELPAPPALPGPGATGGN